MRKLLATLAAAGAALGIAAATMSAAAPNSPATDADVVASGSFGSGQAYVLLPYIEQDNIYRQFQVTRLESTGRVSVGAG